LLTLDAGDIHRPWLSPLSIATRERYSADLYEMGDAPSSEVGIERLPATRLDAVHELERNDVLPLRSAAPATATMS
jgi:hypothetical protein